MKDEKKAGYILLAKAAGYFQRQLRAHPGATKYLAKRGVSEDTANQFGIGYASGDFIALCKEMGVAPHELVEVGLAKRDEETGRSYARFKDRVVFPITSNNGVVCGFGGRRLDDSSRAPKYLNSPSSDYFDKGAQLYRLSEVVKDAEPALPIISVEGYMDVVMLAEQGVSTAVAGMGTAFTEQHADLLRDSRRDIIFLYDGDKAGQAAMRIAARTVLAAGVAGDRVYLATLPKGDDPDTWAKKLGAKEVWRHLKNREFAVPVASWLEKQILALPNAASDELRLRNSAGVMSWLDVLYAQADRVRVLEALATYLKVPTDELMIWSKERQRAAMEKSFGAML